MKTFDVIFSHHLTLTAEQIWGVHAPEDVNEDDVRQFIEDCGGASEFVDCSDTAMVDVIVRDDSLDRAADEWILRKGTY